MNAITAELLNLANGCAASGDQVAAKICRDAIVEIERLQEFLSDLRQIGKDDDLREIAAICDEALREGA